MIHSPGGPGLMQSSPESSSRQAVSNVNPSPVQVIEVTKQILSIRAHTENDTLMLPDIESSDSETDTDSEEETLEAGEEETDETEEDSDDDTLDDDTLDDDETEEEDILEDEEQAGRSHSFTM